MRFEWDADKNRSNIKKHRISFNDAVFVFSDVNALSIFDVDSSTDEDRWITMGTIQDGEILVVIHTERQQDTIRIISARRATKNEVRQYHESLR